MSKLKFEKAGSKINRGISILIYGDPGVGKTTLATTLPPEETIILNTEAGLGPVLGKGHVVLNFNSENLHQIDEFYKYLLTEKHPFKYVVFDNISELNEWIILSYTRKRGKEFPEIREHGDVNFKMKEYLHLYRDLVYQGITVVFNAWEFPMDIRQESGIVVTKMFPKLGKRLAGNVCGMVDVVARLTVHEKSQKRWLIVAPNDQYIAKSQFLGLDTNGEVADLTVLLDKLYSYDYGEGKKK
jgi:phage nucleotide-binding protein